MAKFKDSEIRLCVFKFYDLYYLNSNHHYHYHYQYKQKSYQKHNQNGEETDSDGTFKKKYVFEYNMQEQRKT